MSGQDAELDRIQDGVNCAAVLERQAPAWQFDRRGSTRRALTYQRLTSTKSSAPASVPHKTTSSTSGKGYSTFQDWRGSFKAEKCPIRDGLAGKAIGRLREQGAKPQPETKPPHKPTPASSTPIKRLP